MQKADAVLLRNQVCFPLYALSKEVIKLYRPLLDDLGLTYSQYLVMMVLWEENGQTVSSVGDKLLLDSGTLTPLLKRLESKKLISRIRNSTDERVVELFLTANGTALKQQACDIPDAMLIKMNVEASELLKLKDQLDYLLSKIQS